MSRLFYQDIILLANGGGAFGRLERLTRDKYSCSLDPFVRKRRVVKPTSVA